MRKWETETKMEEVTKRVNIRNVCDFCGEDIKWKGMRSFTKFECKIFIREGELYPEGDCSKSRRIDVCPECRKNMLEPWLKKVMKVEEIELYDREGDNPDASEYS